MNVLDFWYKSDQIRQDHAKGMLLPNEEAVNVDDFITDMENLFTLWRTRKDKSDKK